MNPTSGHLPTTVEHIDDIVELTYSALVVSDREPAALDKPSTFDEQFFVEWEVPQG